MLVLSRKQDEKIVIGDSITLMVVSIQGDKVRLGIEAPKDVSIHREEVYRAIVLERAEGIANDNRGTMVGAERTAEGGTRALVDVPRPCLHRERGGKTRRRPS